MKLYGKNPVIERLKTNPKSIRKIYLQDNCADAGYIRKKARKWGIPVIVTVRSKLLRIARHANTQGIVVEVEDFAYVPFDEMLEKVVKKKSFLIFLDGINDPQNFGAIIRSVACLGQFAIVLPRHGSVAVTESVLRVASGGDNFVQVAVVSNLNQAITAAKNKGFSIAGAMTQDGEDLTKTALPFPLGLVIGSEQKGIRPIIQKQIDIRLTIPVAQPRLSFNVAQAVTVFCYEIIRQQKQKNKK